MAVIYIVCTLIIVITHIKNVPSAIVYIVRTAFVPDAVIGGATGITIKVAMQKGIGRGIFSNEAGLGSAPIAAAAAKTKDE